MMLIEKIAGEQYYKMLASIVPAAADIEAYNASAMDGEGYIVTGNVAHIPVKGVLTDTPSYIARYYGGGNTVYSVLQSAIAKAEADPAVETIQYDFDSPGGTIKGLFETMDLMAAGKKKSRAVVRGMAASAAYALASQTGEIVAVNRAASFGSVGVVTSFDVYPEEVVITSTDAPKKRPDVTTEEGKAMVRERLDDIHALMAEYIAKGRGVSEADIKANYGQGGMLLADKALEAGMIDSIEKPQTAAKNKQEVKSMTKEEFKSEHPDIYQAAVDEGISGERKRVNAHLKLAKTYGAEDIAIKAIEEGRSISGDDELMADYLCAGKNKADMDSHEEQQAPKGLGTAGGDDEGLDDGDKVAAAMDAGAGGRKGMVIL